MTVSKQEQELERLSKAIDALNSGNSYPNDPETEELIQVARLVKRSGAADKISSQLIADTVDRLSSELGTRSRKRRKTWVFSGAAGVIAAAWMLITLNTNLFMPEEQNRSYVQNSGDLAQIVQIQREQAGPAANPPQDNLALAGQPEANNAGRGTALSAEKRIAKQEASASPAQDKKTATDNQAADVRPSATVREKAPAAQTEKVLALAGRTARSKTVDSATGEIRQAYATETGDVTLVQGSKGKTGGEAVASAPQAAIMMRSNIAADKSADKEADKKPANQSTTAKSTAKLNKVTVTVDGVEATLEGEQSEDELKKIAETVVKQ